MNELQLCLEVV